MLPMRLTTREWSLWGLLAIAIFTVGAPGASARVLELVDQEIDVKFRNLDHISFSPDGGFVYIDHVRFRRHAGTGELIFEDTELRADLPVISPDGRSLYAVSSRTFRTYGRDVETGALEILEERTLSPAFGPHGYPNRVWLSPDGAHAYVQTYEPNETSLEDLRGIAVFERDRQNGLLTWNETLYDGVGGDLTADDLIFSADGRHAYGIARTSPEADRLVVFSRDLSSGRLEWKQVLDGETIPELSRVQEAHLTPDGQTLYVRGSTETVILRRNPADGSLTHVETLDSIGRIMLGPDNRFVYGFRGSMLDIYSRQEGTGALNLVETQDLPLGAAYPNVSAAKISPDGRQAYLLVDVAYNTDGVFVLARDAESGRFSLAASYVGDVQGDADGVEEPAALVTSSDGRFVYLGAEDFENELVVFSRSQESGALDQIGSISNFEGETSGLRSATNLVLSPDERFLYAGSRISSHEVLAVYEREADGGLNLVETHSPDIAGFRYLRDLAVSPDGRHLYAAGNATGPLIVFARDPDTGGLTYLQTQMDIPGLTFANAIRFSADGSHIYVAIGHHRDQILLLERDPQSGVLALVEAFDIPDEGDLYAVEISPDGRYLYAAGSGVSVLSRDQSSGRLVFLGRQNVRADHLQVSPDGKYVFSFRDAITVHRRDASTGLLTAVEVEDSKGIPYSSFQTGVLSPSGDFLYAGVATTELGGSDAVRVYRVEEGSCRSSWDGLCLGEDRFRVELEWRDAEGLSGRANPLLEDLGDSALFWFFEPDNWEMQLKVLDGCELNDRFWVFAASATEVEFSLRVIDTVTGAERIYFNPQGNPAGAVTDTDAFACSGAPAGGSVRIDLSASAFSAGAPPTRSAYLETTDLAPQKSHRPGLLQGLGGKCLDVEGGVATDGTPVILYDCHGGSNQRWLKLHDCSYHCPSWFDLRVFGDKCLVPGQAMIDGYRRLEIGPCGSPETLWLADEHFPKEFPLKHVETGLCADVLGADTANRTPVVLGECHGGDHQQWAFDEFVCTGGATGACKNQERFLVEVEWRDFDGNVGEGRVSAQGSGDTGLFWFFSPDNAEVMVKVLNGCAINQKHWVFAAATTNLEYTLRVTDTEIREVREYFNPLGNTAPAITDSSAFPCASP